LLAIWRIHVVCAMSDFVGRKLYDSAGNEGQEALEKGNWKSGRGRANAVCDEEHAERVQWVGEGEVVGGLGDIQEELESCEHWP